MNRRGSKDELDQNLIQELISHQAQELTIRKQELESEQKIRNRELDLEAQNIKSQREVAMKQLEYQSDYLKAEQTSKNKGKTKTFLFWAFIISLVIGFFVYSMHIGKEDFAESIFKILIGGVVGFVAGLAKGKSEKNTENTTN